MLSYATVAGVEWCVLTDGDEWRFYNSTAAVDAEEKLFRRVRISDGDLDETADTLALLSRDNIEGNLLEPLWAAHFVDRKVKEALREMLESRDRGIVRLIHRKVPKLKPKQVVESLGRLEVRIDSPVVVRPAGTPLSLEDARRIVGQWVVHYNAVRLHSAIDYIAPKDKLEGRAESILSAREAKLAAARERRRVRRQQAAKNVLADDTHRVILQTVGETEASSAGEQLARDTRSGRDGHPSWGAAASGSLNHLSLQEQDVRSIPHPSENSTSQPPEESLILAGGLSNSR